MATGRWRVGIPAGVRPLTRNGNDWTRHFPLIVEAVAALQMRSCLIDGEAVCCDDNGASVFHVFLSAFDLLELDGQDSAAGTDRGAQGEARQYQQNSDL